MLRHLLPILTVSLSLLPMAADASDLALLSNNVRKGKANAAFPEGTAVVPTEMTVTWVTEGEYATDAETVETSRQGSLKKTILFDGNTGGNWKSRTYSAWRKGEWATLVVDLGAEYALGEFDVWALHEASRDTEAFYVLLSNDGKTYTPHGMASSEGTPLEKDLFARLRLALEHPVKARYVKFRIQRRKTAKQQQIGEIAIWGIAPKEGVIYLQSDSRPKVVFSAETIQSGVVKLDWTASGKLDPTVKQWRIYQGPEPFASVKGTNVKLLRAVPGKDVQAIIYPLKPGRTHYFGVTAVYPQGEYPLVTPVAVQMPMPLACETFGDMVAINHFWSGGGHRVSHGANQKAYEEVALDLLAETGIRHIRWWAVDPRIYRKYYEKGIGVYTYPHRNNIPEATRLGVNVFSGPGNEPDLNTAPTATYVKNLERVYRKKTKENPDALICAPSSGLEDTSIKWLERFYEQGGKDLFDVLDLHTYCKVAGGHKEPEGYPAGAPEAMYDNMRKIRAILKRHGDTDKPVISTEFGYSEAVVDNPSGHITPQIKAEYLVRGLIIHHALGFKRVFLYSFWDEGEDLNFTEHRFGLIDFDLQKKPAYFAIQTLMDLIGKDRLVGPMGNLPLPSIGYVYENPKTRRLTSVVWDGSGRRRGVFRTRSQQVRRIDLFGRGVDILPDEDGRFSVIYGPSPVYLKTDRPVEYLSSERIPPSARGTALDVKLETSQLIVPSGAAEARLPLMVDNAQARPAALRLRVIDGQGSKVADKEIQVQAATKASVTVRIPMSDTVPALSRFVLSVVEKQASGVGSTITSHPFFLRRLHKPSEMPTTAEGPFYTLGQPVFFLCSDALEVTIDAHRGGRVLEIIDRGSATNQVHMDYGVLPNIENVPFAFGIWDTLNGKLKNSPLRVVAAKGGELTLAGSVDDLEITQTWTLSGGALRLKIAVENQSNLAKRIRYRMHPEYTIGGVGDSVTDVLLFPQATGIEKLPFWTGLGEKKIGPLAENWWAAADLSRKIMLKQWIDGEGWSAPRIWFGQGCYNVELATQPKLTVDSGKTWQATLCWSVTHLTQDDIEAGAKAIPQPGNGGVSP